MEVQCSSPGSGTESFFTTASRPDLGPIHLATNNYQKIFPLDKVTTAWKWHLTAIWC